ncbi:MAG: hypothetical protein AAF750_02620 [Planctomycetota bacterium]
MALATALILVLPIVLNGCAAPPKPLDPFTLQADDLPDPTRSAFLTLTKPGIGLGERVGAARVLLNQANTPTDPNNPADKALIAVLVADYPAEARTAVIQSINTHTGPVPASLGDPLLAARDRLQPGDLDQWADAIGRLTNPELENQVIELASEPRRPVTDRRKLIRALGQTRTRTVAEALMELIQPGQPAAVQVAAFDALASLTAQNNLGRDTRAWDAWWDDARRLSDADWERTLRENFTRQRAGNDTRLQHMEQRLLQSQRALYNTTAKADRPAVLAFMLGDPLEPIRLLALELSEQRLLDDQAFAEPLREALRNRLADDSPTVRGRAALLLRDLSDGPGADLIATRLAEAREGEPDVLRAYLLTMSRMPKAAAVDPAEQLLLLEPLRDEAAGALAAAADQELLSTKQRQRIAKRIKSLLAEDDAPSPESVRLLGRVITDKDPYWERLARWTDSPNDQTRAAAAAAWAGSDRSLLLLAKRANDPVIQPIVINAATERGNDPDTLRTLAASRPAARALQQPWERALVAVAGRVTPPEGVLPTVLRFPNRSDLALLRDRLLTAAIDRGDTPRPDPLTPGYLELLLERAETRIVLENPALAIVDYEVLADNAATLRARARERAYRGLIDAYLQVNQIDDAFAIAQRLLSDDGPRIRAGAAADPIVERMMAAARAYTRANRTDDSLKLLDGLRRMLGTNINPELASRLRDLENDTRTANPAVVQPNPPAAPNAGG